MSDDCHDDSSRVSSSCCDFNHSLIVVQAVAWWKGGRHWCYCTASASSVKQCTAPAGCLLAVPPHCGRSLTSPLLPPSLPPHRSFRLLSSPPRVYLQRGRVYSFCPSAICVHFLGGRFYKPVDIHRAAGAVSRHAPRPCSITAGYWAAQPRLLGSRLGFVAVFARKTPTSAAVRRERRDGPERAASCRRINCSSSCL